MVNRDGSYTYTPNAELQRHRQLHLHGERRHGRLQHRDRHLTVAAVNDAAGRAGRQRERHRGHAGQRHADRADVDNPTLTYSLGTPAANGAVDGRDDANLVGATFLLINTRRATPWW